MYYIIKINKNATNSHNSKSHDETAKRHNGKTHAGQEEKDSRRT